MLSHTLIKENQEWICPEDGCYRVICVAGGSGGGGKDAGGEKGEATSFGTYLEASNDAFASHVSTIGGNTRVMVCGFTPYNPSAYGSNGAIAMPLSYSSLGCGGYSIYTTAKCGNPGKVRFGIFRLEKDEAITCTIGEGGAGGLNASTPSYGGRGGKGGIIIDKLPYDIVYSEITESKTWICPKTGKYKVICVAGGCGGRQYSPSESYDGGYGSPTSFGTYLTAANNYDTSYTASADQPYAPCGYLPFRPKIYGLYGAEYHAVQYLTYGHGGAGKSSSNANYCGHPGELVFGIFELQEGEAVYCTVGEGGAGGSALCANGGKGIIVIKEI